MLKETLQEAKATWPAQFLANIGLQKQLAVFVLVGLFLTALDTFIFYILSLTSLETTVINPAAKASAAIVGYFLHRKYTFDGKEWHDYRQIARYISLLLLLILISTLLLALSEAVFEGFRRVPWVTITAKLGVEGVCVALSFLISRYWVYA